MEEDDSAGLRRVVGEALHAVRERILHELNCTGQESPQIPEISEEDKKSEQQHSAAGEERRPRRKDEMHYREMFEENRISDTDVDITQSKSCGADKFAPSTRKGVDLDPKAECKSEGVLAEGSELKAVEQKSMLPAGVAEGVVGGWVSHTLATLLQIVAPSSPASSVSPASSSPSCDNVLASALLDYTWQKLNTGHWRDVAAAWRWTFTWGSIALVGLLLMKLVAALDHHTGAPTHAHLAAAAAVVRACDRGLIMGAPVDDNPLHFSAGSLNKFARLTTATEDDLQEDSYSITQQDAATVTRPLPSVHSPPLDRFLLHYMAASVPVKLLGVVDHWPAIGLWNVAYLRQVAGARIVPVEVGARYTDSSWSQALMTLDNYLTTYVTHPTASTPTGYLAQHQLFDQIPQLRDDIVVPDYCHLGEEPPRLHAWLGPRGTVSPLHHDPDHNILVQVVGYKYIRLYEEDQSELVYPHPDPLLSNTSQADVEGPSEDWPLLQQAQYHDLLLAPGDALYIPPRCWHYVRSLSISFSVSFWWK